MSRRTSAIGRQFNRSAHSYDAHAHVQRTMADRLMECLNGWKSNRSSEGLDILEIGCGTGALTERLAREWPSSTITALDIAPAMIQLAEQRGLPDHRIRFLLEDIETWAIGAANDSFDFIMSNACFQWLSSPEDTLIHLRRMLRPGGLLLFTTFGTDTFRELHQSFHEAYLVNGMEPQRHGLSFQKPSQWNHLLEDAGFATVQYEQWKQTEHYPSARQFLLAVKAMGASSSEAAVRQGLSSRRLFADMYKAYEGNYSTPTGVAATYDLLLFKATL